MITQKQKFLLIVSGLVLVLSLIVNWSQLSVYFVVDKAVLATVDILDVGQGDAIYIRTVNDVDVLIDGGPDRSILNELGVVMSFWDNELDAVILTHPHADHVGGLVDVLRRYKVKKVYYTGVLHNAPDYIAWLEEIKKQNIPLEIVAKPFDLQLNEQVKLAFLYPNESLLNRKLADLNDSSIVNLLTVGENKVLLTGDAGLEIENKLMEDNRLTDVDILKVGHHGSYTATGEEFLDLIKPEWAIILVGLENSFGHPHGRVLARLQRLGVKIWRTDVSGRAHIWLSEKAYGIE